jgi:ferritin-like metal-binding protein YciE
MEMEVRPGNEPPRVRLVEAKPRRQTDVTSVATKVLPFVAGTAAVWFWRSRRRRVNSLEQLLVHGMTELYEAEQQQLEALSRMRAAAWNDQLRRALAQHRADTEVQLHRLGRVFQSIGAKPARGSSSVVAAIVADSERLLARKVDRDVRDAWIIATAQRLEHFEIACYGTVRTYAETLGHVYAAQLLRHTLDEEREANEHLTQLAERFVHGDGDGVRS